MYTRTILEGPGYRFVKNHYSSRGGAPGVNRKPKRKRTPEEMERQNRWNRAKNVQLLILGNFKEGWHVTLTYSKDKRPETVEEAKKILAKFHRRMKAKFKKAGHEYKWIAVTEIGKRGAAHHHLILEDIHEKDFTTQRAVAECWEYITNFSMLYEEGQYEELADYLCKKETKEDVQGCKVSHSRNLVMPKRTKKRMPGRVWREEPKVPKGWMLVKDSLENRICEYTGRPYQHYLLIQTRRSRDGTL